jgi:hypothetical protein
MLNQAEPQPLLSGGRNSDTLRLLTGMGATWTRRWN